jgi:hypothetical protein
VVQERLDIGPAENSGQFAMIAAGGMQMRREPGHRADDVPDPGVRPLAPVAGHLIGGPSFDGLPQPRLPDAGEGQRARRTEHGQVPDIGGCLSGRVAGRGAHVAGQ